jgi:MucR family transcriptional regulator, transcriptional regulator of exopolysaccharide biosynthesis
MVFFGLWMAHSGIVETPVEKSLAAMEMPVRIP